MIYLPSEAIQAPNEFVVKGGQNLRLEIFGG